MERADRDCLTAIRDEGLSGRPLCFGVSSLVSLDG